MTGLTELGLIILIATAFGILARLLRQPTVLAYLVAGAFLGYFGMAGMAGQDTFRLLSDLGIMFLLFLVGLEINYSSLRLVGRSALLLGLGQVAFTAILGFGLVRLMGFTTISAAYLSAALTFSSTVIVVKLLSDKRDLHSLYGKISVGVLLVQDAVAILLLVFLTGSGHGAETNWLSLSLLAFKGLALFAGVLILGRTVLPYIFDRIARSHELLFLSSLAWMFLLAMIVQKLGFSIEVAGFLAGLALANSAENYQIAHRIRPLRDFFLLLFFVALGASVTTSGEWSRLAMPVVVCSLFVILVNPLVILVLMGLMGYRRRTSFFTGISIAQVSEFSLVLVALGLKLGHITEDVVAIITAVGLVTIAISAYLILHTEMIFRHLSKALSFFERKTPRDDSEPTENFELPIVLFGCHRTGEGILSSLPKDQTLVVDFDPEVIRRLRIQGVHYIFGDLTDWEVFQRANARLAKLIISTSPDLEDNLWLIRTLKPLGDKRPKIIVRAETESEADELYQEGADYVLFPHISSGHYLGRMIAADKTLRFLAELKTKDREMLSAAGKFKKVAA